MKHQIDRLSLFVVFTTLLINITSFYYPNSSFGFDLGGALKSLGGSITDTGENQNCREVMDDYGDSETICEPNENQLQRLVDPQDVVVGRGTAQDELTGELVSIYDEGKKLANEGHLDEAIEKFKEVIHQKPNHANAHVNMGLSLVLMGRIEAGVLHYKKALEINPNNYWALLNLGAAYSDYLNRAEEAKDLFEKAVKIHPDDSNLRFNLGLTYYKLKRFKDAITAHKQALSTQPDDAEIHYGLGFAYDGTGEGSLAIKHIKRAKALLKSQGGDIKRISAWGNTLRIYYNKYEGKNQPQPVIEQPTRATGTGFLLGSSNYIITNYHVVKGFNSLQVNFLSGEQSKAKIRANDKANDVAVLELLNPPDLVSNSMVLGDSSSVEMGEKVFTIGYPVSGILGKKPKYAEGVISSTTGISDDPRMFQITVPIQPGNSGGPLFNNKGEVIGITTSSLDAMQAFKIMGAIPQNVNFAIKSSYIKALLQSMPDSMVSLRSIVVVPSDPENRATGLIKQVKNNIVLVEASTDNSLPVFVELDDAKSKPIVETNRKMDLKEKVRLAKKRQAEIDDRFKTLKEMEGIDDSLISIEEKREAIHKFISDYPDHNPKLNEAQKMLELIVQ
jgi:tetratricopeptide (TPR) repeat protein